MARNHLIRPVTAFAILAVSAAALAVALALPSIAHAAPPPNDDFPGVTITTLPYTDTVDTSEATVEPDEPPIFPGEFPAVWYSYTPADDTVLIADTGGSEIPPFIAVFQGTSLAELVRLETVGSADDPLFYAMVFQASAGETYYFQAGFLGHPKQTGNVTFNLRQGEAPPNDDFPGIEISGLPFTHSVDTAFATGELDKAEPAWATVWYNYTAVSDMTLVADTLGSDYDTWLLVRTLDDLVYPGDGIVYNDDANGCAQSRVVFKATAGETLYFNVGGAGYPAETEMLVFNLALAPPSGTPEPSPLCPEPTAAPPSPSELPSGGGPPSPHRPWAGAALITGSLLTLTSISLALGRRRGSSDPR